MHQWNDAELLSAYVNRQSEEAFGVLVERHVALVYCAALRQVQNPQLAEEVTQATFTILAQKARQLSGRATLSGWLCCTAHFVARNALKSEIRRHYREEEAQMESLINESKAEIWQQFAPLLDQAVAQLSDADRNAIVLRFYERKPLNEVGKILGIAPDAAQKRVSRALDKLRKFFAERGVDSTAATIAENLSMYSVHTAPIALAKTATAVALAKGATASIPILSLAKGSLKLMAWGKFKAAAGAATAIILAGTAMTMTLVSLSQSNNSARHPMGGDITNHVAGIIGAEHLDKLRDRLASLNADIATKGILQPPGQPNPVLTGYAYGQFYDWDCYFEDLYLSYYGNSDFCFNNFQAFLSLEKPNGFIPRSFGPKGFGRNQQFKPFLAQIAVLGSKQRGDDFEWLRGAYYDGLGKYINLWLASGADSDSLPVWHSADASGMDNETRRAGRWDSYTDEGTDLACYVYRELQAMAFIAGKLGKPDDQKAYLARSEALAKKVNAILWDDKAGFYFDRDKKTGKRIPLMSAAGFLPLWAGIASPEQARRLVKEHLLNDKEFWLKYPIATYAATEPDFYEGSKSGECNWCGPAWVPVNYMVMHGLLRYGFRDAARELASRTFKMALDKNPVTREFYDSDTGKGNGMNPFWGWSSLAYVMPLEVELGYDPMDDTTPIQPWLSRDLGVKGPQAVSGQTPSNDGTLELQTSNKQ